MTKYARAISADAVRIHTPDDRHCVPRSGRATEFRAQPDHRRERLRHRPKRIETGTSLPRPIEAGRRGVVQIESKPIAAQTLSQSGNRLNCVDATCSATRNSRRGGAGGRCRWGGRQRRLRPIRWNRKSGAWAACQNGWRTRPMNPQASQTARPALPECRAAPSRKPRNTDASARVADYCGTIGRQCRPEACRESTEAVPDRFARRPCGYSRRKPSVARRCRGSRRA